MIHRQAVIIRLDGKEYHSFKRLPPLPKVAWLFWRAVMRTRNIQVPPDHVFRVARSNTDRRMFYLYYEDKKIPDDVAARGIASLVESDLFPLTEGVKRIKINDSSPQGVAG